MQENVLKQKEYEKKKYRYLTYLNRISSLQPIQVTISEANLTERTDHKRQKFGSLSYDPFQTYENSVTFGLFGIVGLEHTKDSVWSLLDA